MLSLLLASAAAISNFRSVQVVKVYDGDTIKVNLPREEEVFGRNLSIRLRGIDSPEIKSDKKCVREDAQKARDNLENFLSGNSVDLMRCKRDKFYRLVCDVTIARQKDQDASAHQLAKGFAVPYAGGHREEWKCLKGKS